MPNVTDIISKLQNILFMQNEVITTQSLTTRNITLKDRTPKDDVDPVDVPFVPDDEYNTHRLYGETEEIEEQEDEEEMPTEVPEAKPVEPGIEGGEEAAMEDPAAMGDMGGDMGTEPGMDAGMGMPGEEKEEPLTPGQIGRVYELKKIYTRLTALENMLQDVTDEEMMELRNLISKAIELFKTLSSNFDVYKEKLDDIIVIFYKFLDISYKKVRDYFKSNKSNED
jgi:hypothetical protein